VIAFFTARWRGTVPLRQVFLHDMLIVGTTINVVAAFCGLLLFAGDAPSGLAATVFFSPLPYNLFLVSAVWKSARVRLDPLSKIARIGAVLWLIATTAI
jgi:hypothetical protein